MAKQQSSAAAARVRKKVKKNVAEGIAHAAGSILLLFAADITVCVI